MCGTELTLKQTGRTRLAALQEKAEMTIPMFTHTDMSHNSPFHLGAGLIPVSTARRRKWDLNLSDSLEAQGVWVSNTDLPDSQTLL